MHCPTVSETLAADVAFDFPSSLAGPTLVPHIHRGAVERARTARAVDEPIATIVDVFTQVC